MTKKKHAELCKAFEERFPKLFNFESCGLLFIDAGDGCLFSIIDQGGQTESLDEDNKDNPESTRHRKTMIMRLPKDRGITGVAIAQKSVQVVSNGEYHL